MKTRTYRVTRRQAEENGSVLANAREAGEPHRWQHCIVYGGGRVLFPQACCQTQGGACWLTPGGGGEQTMTHYCQLMLVGCQSPGWHSNAG